MNHGWVWPRTSSALGQIIGYVTQEPLVQCSPSATLATIQDCQRAKEYLEPSVSDVTSEENEYSPKGCNRYEGLWFFNTHETGTLDGLSEPVCKAETGNPNRVPISIQSANWVSLCVHLLQYCNTRCSTCAHRTLRHSSHLNSDNYPGDTHNYPWATACYNGGTSSHDSNKWFVIFRHTNHGLISSRVSY